MGEPGRDRHKWGTCRTKVLSGAVRCQDCTAALASHPSPQVRALLAAEVGLPDSIYERFATDTDLVVRVVAAKARSVTNKKGKHVA